MRILPTIVHAILDYAMSLALIIVPLALHETLRSPAAVAVPVLLGTSMLAYSLMTDYEGGLVRRLSMSTHVLLDFIGGGLLAVSPFVFGFYQGQGWAYAYILVGVLELIVAAITRVPQHHTRAADANAEAAAVRGGRSEPADPRLM